MSGFAHIQLGTADVARLVAFYDLILPRLGWVRGVEVAAAKSAGVCWRFGNRRWPQFVVGEPFDRLAPSRGHGSQVSFLAASRELVDETWRTAIAAGATDKGAPGLRPRYAPDFYAAYCRDLDGHKLCFVHTVERD